MRKMTVVPSVIVLAMIMIVSAEASWAGQWIVGSVSVRNDDGQAVYGERLAVFLVRHANPVPADPCNPETHRQRLLDCINNRHLGFYKRFQEEQHRPGYLIDQTVTSETGNFAFFDVPVGRCHVVIKFPAMIDGYKVAWQEPVTAVRGRINVVTLTDDNLILPKTRRR